MSLKEQEIKSKRMCTMGTEIHLAIIDDIYFLKNASKEISVNKQGQQTMVVRFKNNKSEIHEQYYLMDGGAKQAQLTKMFTIAQVTASNGIKPTKNDAIGKRLWIFIKETHFMTDGVPVIELGSGLPKVERYIFRLSPYIDNGKTPTLTGQPSLNEGVPSGDFISYLNIAEKTVANSYSINDIDTKIVEKGDEPSFAAPVPVEEENPFKDESPAFPIQEDKTEIQFPKAEESKPEPNYNDIPQF